MVSIRSTWLCSLLWQRSQQDSTPGGAWQSKAYEGKSEITNSSLYGYVPSLTWNSIIDISFVGMIHTDLKSRRKHDCTVYGLSTAPSELWFYQIDPRGKVWSTAQFFFYLLLAVVPNFSSGLKHVTMSKKPMSRHSSICSPIFWKNHLQLHLRI